MGRIWNSVSLGAREAEALECWKHGTVVGV